MNNRPDLPSAVVVGVGGMGMAVARRLCERYRRLLTDFDAGRLTERATMLCAEGHDTKSVVCAITDAGSGAELAMTISKQSSPHVLTHVTGLSRAILSGTPSAPESRWSKTDILKNLTYIPLSFQRR